jgi:hypothetical protein
MFRRLVICFTILALWLPAAAQNKGVGPKEPSAKEELRIRKQRRKESREKRKLEKEERKKIKEHHKRIQTKNVQKRMKKSRKAAMRSNENRREFFLKRWFTKKKGRPARKKD